MDIQLPEFTGAPKLQYKTIFPKTHYNEIYLSNKGEKEFLIARGKTFLTKQQVLKLSVDFSVEILQPEEIGIIYSKFRGEKRSTRNTLSNKLFFNNENKIKSRHPVSSSHQDSGAH